MKIGFTCGAFDLLHAGHVLMLEEARRQCDRLVVGLQSDPSLDRAHKNRPVQELEERRVQLAGCRFVDEIVLYETEADLYKLLRDMKPDIRIVGADWKGKPFTGHDLPIAVYFNGRDHGYSSSSLRKRIYESEAAKRAALLGEPLTAAAS